MEQKKKKKKEMEEEKKKKIVMVLVSYKSIKYFIIIMWGPIDPICTNCIGKGWAQYPIPYVQTALERAGPNTQSEDKRVSEDDQ